MPECRHCKTNSWSLEVNEQGICKDCEKKIFAIIKPTVELLQLAQGEIKTTKDLETKLDRCDLIIEYAEKLRPFDYLQLTFPPASAIVTHFKGARETFIVEHFQAEYHSLRASFTKDTPINNKIDKLKKLSLKARKYLEQVEYKTKMQTIIEMIEDHIKRLKS